jgi:hypothetical protein
MNARYFLLVLCTACARGPAAPQAVQVPVAVGPTSLRLRSTPLPVIMGPSFTQQAVHDFARQRGAPYSVLYLRIRTEQPDGVKCLRVVQRGPTQFTYYAYHPQRVDSVSVTDSTWHTTLSHFATGHFLALGNGSSEPGADELWLKHDTTTQFSVYLDRTAQTFSAAEEARLVPLRKFISQLNRQGE